MRLMPALKDWFNIGHFMKSHCSKTTSQSQRRNDDSVPQDAKEWKDAFWGASEEKG